MIPSCTKDSLIAFISFPCFQRTNVYKTAITLSIIILFWGCAAVGPDYQKPEVKLPDTWQQKINVEISKGSEASIQTWWQIFADTTLDNLIEQARQSNLDLQTAFSRVLEARAELAVVSGEEWPTVVADGTVSYNKLSDDGVFRQIAPDNGFEAQGLLALGVDAIWEIDVFGRVSRQVESEQAMFEASIEEYRDVLVTLYAEVALNYIDVRAYQQRILNAIDNREAQQTILELAEDRFAAGLTSKLDVVQARYNLAVTKSVIPVLEIGLNYAINRLELWLDIKSDSLRIMLIEKGVIPSPQQLVETGIPADVLRQRPDIRTAERVLASRTAEIGVATADLYPTFSIAGFFGLSSRSVNNLFDASSFTWGFALPFNWAVFDRGRIFSNITVYEERARQSLLHYYNTINKAYEEVDNAIDSYNKYNIRTEYLMEGVEANKEAVELVTIQYDKGLTDFQNVLNTQRSLFQQQDDLLQSETQVVVDLVALYKALGGGWDSQADSTEAPINELDIEK